MKRILILVLFALFNQVTIAQETIKNELNELFLGLNLETNVKEIISKSKLKFETFKVKDSSTGEIDKTFVANFDNNKLIQSKILSAECSIYQKNSDIEKEKYTIDLKMTFKTLEEVINEYNRLSVEYEKFGVRVLETTEEGNTNYSGFQNKVISIEHKSKLITLTFMYPIPLKDTVENNLYIICNFKKLWYK